MDRSLTILCSLGGVLNGLAYEGGLVEVLLIDRNISFVNLRNLIIEIFSIDYEFLLVHIYLSNCINLVSEQAWKFILEVNIQSPYINIFVTPPPPPPPPPPRISSAPSSSHQVISFMEEEHRVDDGNTDDENSDDLIENIDDELDDNVDNEKILFIGREFINRHVFRSFISDIAIAKKKLLQK